MPGRSFSATNEYRYGFNGKENDKDISAGGQDYGARIYDTRIGRWLSTDPITKPFITPYNFGSNNPINFIDPDGADDFHFYFFYDKTGLGKEKFGVLTKFVVIVKNNEANRFIHHKAYLTKDNNGTTTLSDKPTEFYPMNRGHSIGLTSSKVWGVNIADDDYTTLMKYSGEFPEIQNEANYSEFNTKGAPVSKEAQNAQFWGSVIRNNGARIAKDEKEKANGDFAKAAVVLLASEYIVGDLLLESLAARALAREEAAVDGAHFLSRHGAQTTMEQQLTRATTGLTPDGVQKTAVNSSKFFSNRLQLEALKKAKSAYTGKGSEVISMGRDVGSGYLKGGGSIQTTTQVQVYYNNAGNVITMFPKL